MRRIPNELLSNRVDDPIHDLQRHLADDIGEVLGHFGFYPEANRSISAQFRTVILTTVLPMSAIYLQGLAE